jgi:hypothetical protein
LKRKRDEDKVFTPEGKGIAKPDEVKTVQSFA